MITMLLLQFLMGLVAWFMGTHDAPACDEFYNKPADPVVQKLFHNTNMATKGMLWIIGMLAIGGFGLPWIGAALQGLCYVAIMWPAFNIGLNIHRKNPKRNWDYISSESNNTDAWLTDIFGTKAGAMLVYLCGVVLVISNIILIMFYAKFGGDIVWLG